jgi:parallel beta-helix repeat protein
MRSLVLGFSCLFSSALTYSATYYVAKTGSDIHSCAQAQSASTLKLTIGSGLGCLSAGDTLQIKAGTYIENIDNSIPAGSPGHPTIVQAYSTDEVTLAPTSGTSTGNVIVIAGRSYITVKNLVIDAMNVSYHGIRLKGSTTNVLIEGCEIKNAHGTSSGDGDGIFMQEKETTNNTVRSSKVHDCGNSNLSHGIYLRSPNNIIEECSIYSNSGHGIHAYYPSKGVDNNIIRNNDIYSNGSWGILLGSGDNNIAYNNIIRNNKYGGIRIGFNSPTNNKVYNNTIYSNATGCIKVLAESSGAEVKNNICWKNGTDTAEDLGSGSAILSNLFSDPKFVDPTSYDFDLLPTSPAIDKGLSLSVVFDDYSKTRRPQGGGYDIGAFEYSVEQKSAPANVRIVAPK